MLQLLDVILYASGRRDAEENPRKKHKKCDAKNDNEVHQSMNSRGSGGEVSGSEVQVQQIDAQPNLQSAQNGQIGEMIVVRQEEELEVGEEERNAKAVVTTAEPLDTFPGQASQVQSSQAETFGTSSSDDEFPAGPEDTSVVKSFQHHIAHAIWKGKYREALCTKWSGGALGSWKYTDECPNFQDKISKTGLQCVIDATYTRVNRALISALVERWHLETNTFHFPCGEMTITIDDVVQLTGLKADGRAFSGDGHVSADYAKSLLKNGLGYTEKGVDELFSSSRGYTLKFTQLRYTFRGKCTNDDDEEMIDHHCCLTRTGSWVWHLEVVLRK